MKQQITFKKIVGIVHLGLGLASGILVCFLGITGCLLVFEQEIKTITVPEQFVAAEARAFAAPSLLKVNAEARLQHQRKVVSVDYPGRNKAALAYYYTATEYWLVYLNPYSGEVLRATNMNRDFFRMVLNGHYYLWLPPSIGQPILASATLLFLIMLITGIVLWWPKNKAARKQRFSVKWNARWRRVNYDLHNVPGFYAMLIALFLAVTGLTMGFQWFSKTVYFVSSGGKAMPPFVEVFSDTSGVNAAATPLTATDKVFYKMLPTVGAAEGIGVEFPADEKGAIELSINHHPGTYFNRDNYYFDQHSLSEIPVKNVYAGKYNAATVADKIQRMNYDIHVGAIGGLFTKILAFLGSLVSASLPVTGFLIWYGRKKKSKRQTAAPARMARV